jgi:hypothetical protein
MRVWRYEASLERGCNVFTYPNFDVDVFRRLDGGSLSWPEPGAATDDSGLGGNRAYADLRRLSWTDAKRAFALEGELIDRIENAEDSEAECDVIDEELNESDDHLFGLDVGVASTVVCLSAARCVPFSSCNGGAFGGRHQEAYPLVAFFAKAQMVDLLVTAATNANIGLQNHASGCAMAYSDDIRKLRKFAGCLIGQRQLFNAVRIRAVGSKQRGRR